LLEYLYGCTSLVLQDSKGRIIHGRNMDFIFTEYLEDIFFELRFMKNKQLLFTAISPVGTSGLGTFIKPGKFAMSINVRP
jgi:hypothetical protein